MNKKLKKRHQLKALREAGLPASYHTLLKYEELGIMKPSGFDVNGDRWYTEEQIEENIRKIKEYKE